MKRALARTAMAFAVCVPLLFAFGTAQAGPHSDHRGKSAASHHKGHAKARGYNKHHGKSYSTRRAHNQPRHSSRGKTWQTPHSRYYQAPRSVHFKRGQRLPSHYHGPVYVVSDWRSHKRLHRPPHGHQWRRVGGDYILVAIASSVITQIIMGDY